MIVVVVMVPLGMVMIVGVHVPVNMAVDMIGDFTAFEGQQAVGGGIHEVGFMGNDDVYIAVVDLYYNPIHLVTGHY